MTDQRNTHYALLRRLKEFDFAPRERLVVELILEKSFGLDRTRAHVPRLEIFVAMTRISRGNVSLILRRLIRCRVIEECAAGVYAIRLPMEQWAIPPRIVMTTAIRELDTWLKMEPAQMELLPEPPSLTQALREINFPTLCRESAGAGTLGVTAARRYVGPSSPVQHSQSVPDLGTAVPDLGTAVPDLGTAGVTRYESGALPGVPESGTAFKAFKVQSLKPSEEALSSELLKEGECEGKPLTRIGNARQAEIEAEWMARALEVVGAKAMERYGGWYRNRLRENRSKFERVLNAVASDQREGTISRNAGGHFFDLWGRFAD